MPPIVGAARLSYERGNDIMFTTFDWSEIPERKRHIYFYVILILLTLLAATIKRQYFSSPPADHRELSDGVKRLMESGSTSKDLY